MLRCKSISILLLLVALTWSCQTQSYTDVNPPSSSGARQQLVFSQPAEAQPSINEIRTGSEAIVVSTKANLRETPNTSGLVSLELDKGEALNLLEDKAAGPWYKVRHLRSGKTGWIHGNTIKLDAVKPPAITEQSASSGGSNSLPPARPRRVSGSTAGSSGDTYTNSYGEEVPRPGRSSSIPAGASARCGDGTYSFSRSRRGTCSHHGGVAQWL